MISVSENIKRQAIEVFDNFITQVILPNEEEVKGILEHNRSVLSHHVFDILSNSFYHQIKICRSQIIVKFHEAFYSMFNHFLVLCAENLEHFLICSECSTPIGFTHQKNCIRKSMTGQSLWRKTKCDDKFITYGMKFNFYDIVSPEYRQNIIEKIKITCWEQQVQARNQLHRVGAESGPSYMSNSWPTRWLRGDGDRNRDEKKENKIPRLSQTMITTTSSMKTNLQSPPLFQSSPWTPAQNDTKSMPTTKFEITTFAEQFKLDKLF